MSFNYYKDIRDEEEAGIDDAVRNAVLGLPDDRQHFENQQARRPKFKSASMTANPNPHMNQGSVPCNRCGNIGHHSGECPVSVKNLLVPSSN